MFRAVIKNAGLEDQSTIFILEICFSYQEIQVSRPDVSSATQSTVSTRSGPPPPPQTAGRGGMSRGGSGPGGARRAGRGQSRSLGSSRRGQRRGGARLPHPIPAAPGPARCGVTVPVTGDARAADVRRQSPPPPSPTGASSTRVFQIRASRSGRPTAQGSAGPGSNAGSSAVFDAWSSSCPVPAAPSPPVTLPSPSALPAQPGTTPGAWPGSGHPPVPSSGIRGCLKRNATLTQL